MKALVFIVLFSSVAWGGGPKYNYPDPRLNDEIENIYHDIKTILNGYVRISSAAISDLIASDGTTNAHSGCYGEYISSTTVDYHNAPASATWGDLASIDLTAGDWDIGINAQAYNNGATWTVARIGLATTSGGTATGVTNGTIASANWASSSTTPVIFPLHFVSSRFLTSTAVTVYLKMSATYSAGTPQFRGVIFARRIR